MILIEKKYSKLFNNSIIFAIGNLGSKLISFALVPMYTYVLTTEQFGTVDFIITITTMLLPVLSLCLHEAVLRFSMNNTNSKKILNISLSLINIINIFIFIVCGFIFYYTNNKIILYVSIILIFQNIQVILSQYTRAIEKVKVYALNGVIMTFVLLVSNILLLVVFKTGIYGYLCSIIISNFVSIIFLSISINLLKIVNLKSFDIIEIKKLLKFSLPLMPNNLMWWVMNASSRLFIVYYFSASENGLFAVSAKIPTIISVVYAIFFQAWQLSAIDEYKSKDSSKFYTDVFKYLSLTLILLSSVIIIFVQPIVKIILSQSFYESWKYVPLLLVANIFSSFSSFVGTTYTVSLKTKGAFTSSFLGAIISVFINLLLIPRIGIAGACMSQFISFMFIWIYRHIETNKMIEIKIAKEQIISICIIILQSLLVFFITSSSLLMVVQGILFIFIFIVNINNIKVIFVKIKVVFVKRNLKKNEK
ncbi:oligosaccharide flippase family protein [Vagococcus fluvialis]|uniref:oligosaccharide flippase family protein n=1 Tax=Vagococcus fluvialis TaxID=2738 RepID=UPI0028920F6B|nr:oligosaccharide flippase family protein [Vagococcus fluvialis]MDT2747769.1 oligosaccharide flippase family protein [Vagococcus fluvialis]